MANGERTKNPHMFIDVEYDQTCDKHLSKFKRLMLHERLAERDAQFESALSIGEDLINGGPFGESLLKKHKEVTEEINNYASVIDDLRKQADALAQEAVPPPEVEEKLASIQNSYKELLELNKVRKQRLLYALTAQKFFLDCDNAERWINKQDRILDTIVIPRDFEDAEAIRDCYDSFGRKLNANAYRIANVCQIANQLKRVNHPNFQQMSARLDQLVKKWYELKEKLESKKSKFSSAYSIPVYYEEVKHTMSWIEDKILTLTTNSSIETDFNAVLRLRRQLPGLKKDVNATRDKVVALEEELRWLEGERHAGITESVIDARVVFGRLTEALMERNGEPDEVVDLNQFLRDLDFFRTCVNKIRTDILSQETPSWMKVESYCPYQAMRDEIDAYKKS